MAETSVIEAVLGTFGKVMLKARTPETPFSGGGCGFFGQEQVIIDGALHRVQITVTQDGTKGLYLAQYRKNQQEKADRRAEKAAAAAAALK